MTAILPRRRFHRRSPAGTLTVLWAACVVVVDCRRESLHVASHGRGSVEAFQPLTYHTASRLGPSEIVAAARHGRASVEGAEPMTYLAGARLGPYESVAPLGAGGMGEVFRARDTRLG